VHVGSYRINVSGLNNADYEIHYAAGDDRGTLTINARSITIKADEQNKTYGDGDPALTYAVTSGTLIGGDSFGGSLTRDSGETVVGGPYQIRQGTVNLSSDYDLHYLGAALAISRAPLTVTVANKSKVLNAPLPAFTGTISGIKFTDNIAATYGTTATASSPVGTYPITATLADPDGKLPNYNVSNTPGTLTITYALAGTSCNGEGGHTILQPINADGSSVFKQGSTVPAKFRVCDFNGISIGTPGVVSSFKLTQTISGIETNTNEAVTSTTPDTAFRWDSTAQQWIFNVNTKSLNANKTYVYTVTLNDGTTIPFRFGLK
jgi:hypothetical protein